MLLPLPLSVRVKGSDLTFLSAELWPICVKGRKVLSQKVQHNLQGFTDNSLYRLQHSERDLVIVILY